MERVSIKPLKDEYGVIKSAKEILPKELWNDFIESIAELEDNNSHITATYPKTRLHKVAGSKNQFTGQTSNKPLDGGYTFNSVQISS